MKEKVDSSFIRDVKPKSHISYRKHRKIDGFQFQPNEFVLLDADLVIGKNCVGLINKILVVDNIYIFYLQLHEIMNKHHNNKGHSFYRNLVTSTK